MTVQRKATEYGCSADAVLQLLPLLLGEGAPLGLGAAEEEGAPPAMLLVVDQFGLCHAPTGPVRQLASLTCTRSSKTFLSGLCLAAPL